MQVDLQAQVKMLQESKTELRKREHELRKREHELRKREHELWKREHELRQREGELMGLKNMTYNKFLNPGVRDDGIEYFKERSEYVTEDAPDDATKLRLSNVVVAGKDRIAVGVHVITAAWMAANHMVDAAEKERVHLFHHTEYSNEYSYIKEPWVAPEEKIVRLLAFMANNRAEFKFHELTDV